MISLCNFCLNPQMISAASKSAKQEPVTAKAPAVKAPAKAVVKTAAPVATPAKKPAAKSAASPKVTPKESAPVTNESDSSKEQIESVIFAGVEPNSPNFIETLHKNVSSIPRQVEPVSFLSEKAEDDKTLKIFLSDNLLANKKDILSINDEEEQVFDKSSAFYTVALDGVRNTFPGLQLPDLEKEIVLSICGELVRTSLSHVARKHGVKLTTKNIGFDLVSLSDLLNQICKKENFDPKTTQKIKIMRMFICQADYETMKEFKKEIDEGKTPTISENSIKLQNGKSIMVLKSGKKVAYSSNMIEQDQKISLIKTLSQLRPGDLEFMALMQDTDKPLFVAYAAGPQGGVYAITYNDGASHALNQKQQQYIDLLNEMFSFVERAIDNHLEVFGLADKKSEENLKSSLKINAQNQFVLLLRTIVSMG